MKVADEKEKKMMEVMDELLALFVPTAGLPASDTTHCNRFSPVFL